MSTENKNGQQPAFARTDDLLAKKIGHGVSEEDYLWRTSGLTKREYFAATAMLGLIANAGGISGAIGETYHDATAKEAILLADALLHQLNPTP